MLGILDNINNKFWKRITKENDIYFGREHNMNIEQLREQLIIDEGQVNEIYNDHLGYPTFGIGHLVLDSDEESGSPVGTSVTEDRVKECFAKDVITVLGDCKILHEGWDSYPEEVKQVVANMMFNMGRTRLSKFSKHNAALVSGDWKTAAVEGRDSRWYKQVTNRAERLMSRLEEV
jgi:lysozyme